MKKLLFIILAIFSCVVIFSQESSVADKYLGYEQTWFTYNGLSNALTATDSVWYFTVQKESNHRLFYDFKVDLDSVGGTAQVVPVVIQGKKFLSDSFTPLDTITWTAGADTTIYFSESTTAQQYRYYRTYIRSELKGFLIKITELSGKLWEE